MAEMTAKIPISRVVRETTLRVEVTGIPSFKFRLTVAKCLIQLAAFVAGMGIEIKTKQEEQDNG